MRSFLNVALLAAFLAGLGLLSPSASLPAEIAIFSIAALGLYVLFGIGGLLSFGQSAFFGGGAYFVALVMGGAGYGALATTLAGGLTGAVLALVFGAISLRTRGIYFVMVSLVFGQIVYYGVLSAPALTGGENGLADVVRPDLTAFGYDLASLQDATAFYVFAAAMLCAAFAFVQRLVDSPLGATLAAIRDNERRMSALGYRVWSYRLVAFCISGFLTGAAGALYSALLRYLPLNTVEFALNEELVVMVILGGLASPWGPVLGATAFILVAEFLSPIWPRWLLLVGLALIAIVIFLPGGLSSILPFGRKRASTGASH